MILGKIHSLARKTIGSNHLETIGILKIGIKIERQELVRKLIVEQFAVEDTPLSYQMANTDILVSGPDNRC